VQVNCAFEVKVLNKQEAVTKLCEVEGNILVSARNRTIHQSISNLRFHVSESDRDEILKISSILAEHNALITKFM
jgi:hypothetical protein